jgi:excisionase family DNA binding protein
MTQEAMKLYTVSEAAEILGISQETLRGWIWKQKFPVVRAGNRLVRIRQEDIRTFIDSHYVEAKAFSKGALSD